MTVRVELGSTGSESRRNTFFVDTSLSDGPFGLQYDQGNNHWESGAVVLDLEGLKARWPDYRDWILECGCAWALPIIEEGFRSMKSEGVVERLVEWSKRLRGIQYER